MAALDGSAQDRARAREPNALWERVEGLEAEGVVRRELDRRLVEEGGRGGSIHWRGCGLPRRARPDRQGGLRKHVEADFRLAEAFAAAAMHGAAIDAYGWPIWTEASRFLRCPVHVLHETIMVQGEEPRDLARSETLSPTSRNA